MTIITKKATEEKEENVSEKELTKEDVAGFVLRCKDIDDLKWVARLAWDKVKELDRKPASSAVMAKLLTATKGAVLTVKWRGTQMYEAEFERINRTTVTAFVREVGKVYRFPVGWVTDVRPPDGKTRSMPSRFRRGGLDIEPGGPLHDLEK
jgi:hypothetical protein